MVKNTSVISYMDSSRGQTTESGPIQSGNSKKGKKKKLKQKVSHKNQFESEFEIAFKSSSTQLSSTQRDMSKQNYDINLNQTQNNIKRIHSQHISGLSNSYWKHSHTQMHTHRKITVQSTIVSICDHRYNVQFFFKGT